MTKGTRRGTVEMFVQIMAFMKEGEPKTWDQVKQGAGLHENSAYIWFRHLRAAGVLRIAGYDYRPRQGRPPALYEFQEAFARPDELKTFRPRGVAQGLCTPGSASFEALASSLARPSQAKAQAPARKREPESRATPRA